MAKQPEQILVPGAPKPPEPYPGSERFGDWGFTNTVPVDPGEQLVNDDPDDPFKLANQGKPDKE